MPYYTLIENFFAVLRFPDFPCYFIKFSNASNARTSAVRPAAGSITVKIFASFNRFNKR